MTFAEIIISETEQKYLDLLAGSLDLPVPRVTILSYQEYKEKAHTLHQRLNREAEAVKEALASIKEAKKHRGKEEPAAAQNTPARETSTTETKTSSGSFKKWLFIGIGGLIAWAIMPKVVKTILIIAAIVAVVVSIMKKRK